MNKPLTLNAKFTENFVSAHEFEAMKPFVSAADKLIKERNGLGNDFLGWVALPENYDKEEFDRVKKAAEKIRKDSDVLVVIGIGGSYLGSRAVIEFCAPVFGTEKEKSPEILFLGNNLSPTHMVEVLNKCKGKRVSVNVISKSGTTTEPALAFRVMKDYLEKEYGEAAKDRIYATTDKARGTLKNLSTETGYETFVIPDDVGGRFSVLTPVGLLPIAVAGLDIDALMAGAQQAMKDFDNDDLDSNDCYRYATLRSIMHRKGKTTEVTVGYEPFIASFCEWIKQLHGESEGKDNKGLFPASMIFSTDLHSLGQYVQQGLRNLFETVLWIKNPKIDMNILSDPKNLDGLNFLSDKTLNEINRNAFMGTVLAHVEGGVPNIVLEMEDASEYSVGYLIYFYEKACALAGYMNGVNPFDQPGVESYKKNMFALLGKPGYEEMKAELEAKLK